MTGDSGNKCDFFLNLVIFIGGAIVVAHPDTKKPSSALVSALDFLYRHRGEQNFQQNGYITLICTSILQTFITGTSLCV
jgi:hypothetical protein